MTRAILTCSPLFIESALNEVRRPHTHLAVIRHISPGNILLQAPYSFDKLTQPWRKRLPIYLHHMFPVHAVLALDGNCNDLPLIQQTIRDLAPEDASVQVRCAAESDVPYSANMIHELTYGSQVQSGTHPAKGRVVSVLIVREQAGLRVYMGVSWATQNISPWPGGQISITEAVSNRAGYKLFEALSVFGIRLRTGNQALDLGAAPGAWTTILRRYGLHVTAVAPAPLYPWLTVDREVTHHALRAEDYIGHCETVFDLIVNDMKLDVQDSARMMVAYAQHLRTEGIGLMTLKLRERNQQRVMDQSFRILRRAYKIIRVRQLVYNRNEVTLFLRKKC